jgi:predicted nucleic acid-binding protein
MLAVPNFLDTNILIYAFTDDDRSTVAQSLMAHPFALSVQALNEAANVFYKKWKLPWQRIEEAVEALVTAAHVVVPLDAVLTSKAIHIADRYILSYYDALMVSAALEAQCLQFYSEDLHHGLRIEDTLTVVNPFR